MQKEEEEEEKNTSSLFNIAFSTICIPVVVVSTLQSKEASFLVGIEIITPALKVVDSRL